MSSCTRCAGGFVLFKASVNATVGKCYPTAQFSGSIKGDGGGGGVEGDEGRRQGPSKAPGQKALPRYHLQYPSNMESIFIAMNLRGRGRVEDLESC